MLPPKHFPAQPPCNFPILIAKAPKMLAAAAPSGHPRSTHRSALEGPAGAEADLALAAPAAQTHGPNVSL